MPDTTDPQSADLAARLEATLTERFTELGNPYSRMRIAFQGPDGWPASKEVGPHDVAEVLRELLAAEPAAPPAADRADELAKHVTRAIFALKSPAPPGSEHYRSGWDDGLEAAIDAARDAVLRRVADGEQQAETQAAVLGCGCPDEDAMEHGFGTPDCTCIPFTRQTDPPRYLNRPTDTVDMISGWERGGDCPHHTPPAVVAEPGKEN